MDRRQFVTGSAAGLGVLAGSLGMKDARGEMAAAPRAIPALPSEDKIGRPVRIVSIGTHGRRELEQLTGLVDQEGARGTDVIVLKETCRGYAQEPLDGPTLTAMAGLARKHSTYIVCPITRADGDLKRNSAVMLDRNGKVLAIYNKLYPVWQSECARMKIQPGEGSVVCQTDFGRVGLSICFDVNWVDQWEQMANRGAELVIWPSAYSAGRTLQARAINYNYYIVSCTGLPDCLVFDIDGDQLLHEENNRGDGLNISRTTLDLDRCIFHCDINEKIRPKLLAEHPDDIAVDKDWRLERWFVMKSKRAGVSARELCRQYGMEELKAYLNRSRCEIDKCLGWEFA